MAYLHSLDILHGDLSGNNILLACNNDDQRGFTAKVADFGMARILGESQSVQTRAIGTITHMPPELMLDGAPRSSSLAHANANAYPAVYNLLVASHHTVLRHVTKAANSLPGSCHIYMR